MSDDTPKSPAAYEFTPSENDVLRELARTLSVTGLVLMALSIVAILYAGAFIVGSREDPAPLVVAAFCAPMVIAGFWLRSVADPLMKIVDTQGNDIAHLMSAMREFQRIFALQRVGFALALVVAMVGIVVRSAH